MITDDEISQSPDASVEGAVEGDVAPQSEKNDLISKLLEPLPSGDGVGESIRYEHIFDQIREARREEDPNLSQGVWKIETKKAEWDVVESLSIQVLTERSKDLQVAIWLTESWVVRNGLKGLKNGMGLLNGLTGAFWDTLHPQIEDGDMEHRIHLFEWFDNEISSRCLLLPIARSIVDVGGNALTLSDWIGAVDLDRISKRSQDPKAIVNTALSRGKIDLKGFRKILTTTSVDSLSDLQSDSEYCLDQLNSLEKFLEEKIPSSPPSIARLRQTLGDFKRLCEMGVQQSKVKELRQKNINEDLSGNIEDLIGEDGEANVPASSSQQSSGDGPVVISERQHAYQALRDISRFLSALEPHSPVPQLLQMMGGWEEKTITEILSDIRSQPIESQLLLRLLADAGNDISSKS